MIPKGFPLSGVVLHCANLERLKTESPRIPFPLWYWVSLAIQEYTRRLEGGDKASLVILKRSVQGPTSRCISLTLWLIWWHNIAQESSQTSSSFKLTLLPILFQFLGVLSEVHVQVPDEGPQFLQQIANNTEFRCSDRWTWLLVCPCGFQSVLMDPSLSLLYLCFTSSCPVDLQGRHACHHMHR